ncbi:MAG: isoprenylcysteine carboxylmethyltransferase family protein [bacterium]
MDNNSNFKDKIRGLIMPLGISALLALVYSTSRMPLSLQTQGRILVLVIMMLWGAVEAFAVQGSHKIDFDLIDRFLKAGALIGLILSMIFGDVRHKFIIYLGFFILILGIILRYLAIRALGINFSYNLNVRKAGQSLVDYGVYHNIRHPGYLGVFLIMSSLPLIHASLTGFLVVTICSWIWINRRISREEKIMISSFPDLYEAYRKRTKRLIPFIY